MENSLYLCSMKKLIITITTTFLLLGCQKTQVTDYQQGIADTKSHVHECHIKTTSILSSYNPNDKVVIVGLNNVDRSRLSLAERVIKNFYGFQTEIRPYNQQLDSRFYADNSKTVINCDPFVRSVSTGNERIVFVSNETLRGNVSPIVKGYTTLNGRVIIVTSTDEMKETLIHEIGHTYGLLHCNNLSCVMAIDNDQYETGKFCSNCKSTINYYR